MGVLPQDQLPVVGRIGAVRVSNEKSGNDCAPLSHIEFGTHAEPLSHSLSLYEKRLDIWQRDVPWSSVKQLRSVAETEFSTDDVFDKLINNFRTGEIAKEGVKAHSKSKKVEQAHGSDMIVYPFRYAEQDTGTKLQYRKIPLPW